MATKPEEIQRHDWTEEERAWWLAVLRRLSASARDADVIGHFARKLVAMSPREQMGIAAALLTVRRYVQQNEHAAVVQALEGYPAPLAEVLRKLAAS
jgi:hypothetical protein